MSKNQMYYFNEGIIIARFLATQTAMPDAA